MASKRQFKLEIEDGIELINISSDDTESLGGVSVSTFDSAEYQDEVAELVFKMEYQVSSPKLVAGRKMTCELDDMSSTTSPSLPSTSARTSTPKSKLSKSYFDLRNANAPYRRNSRPKKAHPIAECSSLRPIRDSPLSPPSHERGPRVTFSTPSPLNDLEIKRESDTAAATIQQQDPNQIRSHLQGIRLPDGSITHKYSDCVICGKSVERIREDTVQEYLGKTAAPGESAEITEIKRKAFEDGMQMGTVMFLPAGLSQAAACDGLLYTLSGPGTAVMPGTLPVV